MVSPPPLSRSTHSAQIHPIWRIRWGFSWTPPGRVLKQQPASRTHRPHARVASSSVTLLSHSGLCHLVRDSTSPPPFRFPCSLTLAVSWCRAFLTQKVLHHLPQTPLPTHASLSPRKVTGIFGGPSKPHVSTQWEQNPLTKLGKRVS